MSSAPQSPSSASKQEAIRSAKLKLKNYRAKQKRASNPVGHARQLSHTRKRSSVDLKPMANPKRLSLQPQSLHAHKRSLSRNANNFVFPSPRDGLPSAPPLAPSASSNRRLSQQGRRHSRTESILDTGLVNGHVIPIPESWSFPQKSPGLSVPPYSTGASSMPVSPCTLSSTAMQQQQSSQSSPPCVQSTQHTRRGSRHSRQLSMSTRRESMDLMAGFNLSSFGQLVQQETDERDPEAQRRDALEALEGSSSRSITPTAPAVEPPAASHLSLPESQQTSAATSPRSPVFQHSITSAPNKRASWGPVPANPEQMNQKSDLGSVIEEEEEDEEAQEEAEGVSELPVMTPPAPSKRPRPASLFFQPMSARRTSLLAENGTPNTAANFPASDSAISMKPESFESPTSAATTTDSAAAPPPRRGLKSLSLSMSPNMVSSSATNTGAQVSSSADASAKKQRRQSGLRSLTLGSQNSNLPGSPASDFTASPHSASTSAAAASAVAAASSPLANKRQSLISLNASGPRSRTSSVTSSNTSGKRNPKTSSISYRYNGEPTVASWQQRMSHASPVAAHLEDEERSEWGANDSEFGNVSESARSGPSTSQTAITALRNQISESQQECAMLKEELATAKALHASSTASAADAATTLEGRLSELQTRLSEASEHHKLAQGQMETELSEMRSQLEDLRSRLEDAVSERDALVDDVEGWRSRCADLTAALERERQALDTEKKDGALAREKVRKLGDKLAALSGAQDAAEEKDDALTTAQAKLINEMRDQIFSLAAALDQEKRQHASVAQQLQVLQNEQSWQIPSHHNDSVDASTASSFLHSSLGSSFGGPADESSFTSLSSFDSSMGKPEFSASLNGPGGLQTLAEEDEEDAERDLEAGPADEGVWSDEDDVPELDFHGTQTHAEHLNQARQAGSTSSCASFGDDINETRTPPPPQEQPQQASNHHRSDSFIKQWTFPRGKVTPISMLEPDDHSFFSLSTAQILPPLPVSQEVLEFPNFFSSDLVVDEEERRRSLELETHSRASSSTSTSRSSNSYFRSSQGPPVARSAQLSAALQDGVSSPVSSKSVSRMSLQGIGSLISSYVATPKDGAGGVQGMPGAMAMAGAGLCKPHTREESVFDEDHQSLLRPNSSDSSKPRLLPRRSGYVQASPLQRLDFTKTCGVDSNKVIRI